ncbi:MAG: type IV pilus twitching motility protein PilT [Phycisphaerae bacterium]
MNLQEVLIKALETGASDVHIVHGRPPLFRTHTVLEPAEGYPEVTSDEIQAFIREMVDEKRVAALDEHKDLDFSTFVEGYGRFRVNAHHQRDTVALAFRSITDEVPPLSSLGLPPVIETLTELPRGLVLVTGVTGSGKSTTLASMLNEVNRTKQAHIITLEDPIEYVLHDDRCVIEQREVGSDVMGFAGGLKYALRQDPDVIMVGEMRDLETTSAAITAAETGHLVLSTLHTQGAAQTIERIIDIYPGDQQNQIRAMLSTTLQAVVGQCLFKRIDCPGMVPACEIMLCNSAIRNCIREGRIHEIPNIIETNRAGGMCTLDDSIKGLVLNGYITKEQGLTRAVNPSGLQKQLTL